MVHIYQIICKQAICQEGEGDEEGEKEDERS
jgi:hypothetical protein